MADDDDRRLQSDLARLRDSLSKAREKEHGSGAAPARTPPPAAAGDSGVWLGLWAGSEFVSAVVVGAAIGWAGDRVLGTRPALLIVFFLIGVAAGVWNVIRVTSPKALPKAQDSALSPGASPDKDVPRSSPGAGPDASQGRAASGWAKGAPEGADDED
jgi:ATP synthase protein I